MKKAYWIKSRLAVRWPSADMLAQSHLLRYQKSFNLIECSLDEALSSQENGIYIFGDIHYSGEFILQQMSRLPPDAKILFHLYGDIFNRLKIFELNYDLFKERYLKFVVGSRSAYEIALNCLSHKANLLYLPYFLDEKKRNRKYSDSTNKKIIYFGRISYYKNVHKLIDLFDQFTDLHQGFELHLAGLPDNFRWRNHPTSSYFNYAGAVFDVALQRALKKNKTIVYHGQLSANELHELLDKADIFTSLSTSEIEDFGVSVYEALIHGLKVVTTEWGGYRQFKGCQGVDLLKVVQAPQGLQITTEALFESWRNPEHSRGESIQERNKSWRESPVFPLEWERLHQFQKKFCELKATTSLNQDFYEHGKEILYPLWS